MEDYKYCIVLPYFKGHGIQHGVLKLEWMEDALAEKLSDIGNNHFVYSLAVL